MASTSLRGAGKRFRTLASQIDGNVHKTTKLTALAVDRELVLAMPVDTGRARSNVIVNAGAPITSQREAYAPGDGGSTSAANTQAALDQAVVAVEHHKPDGTIYITNNLDYVADLNAGSSAQAPAGFVEKAVLAGVAVIATAKVVP